MTRQKEKNKNPKGLTRQRNTTLPAYHRLYIMMSQGIKDGTYPPGQLLPSEKSLTQAYGVSRVTVRKALEHLVEDGLVTKQQGRGTIVTFGTQKRSSRQPVSGLLANLVAEGVKFEAKTLFWDIVMPSSFVYQKLNLPLGSQCYVIKRLRSLKNHPVTHVSIYLPEQVGQHIKKDGASNKLILQMLDDTPYAASRTEFTLSASLVDGEAADHLDLPVGTPVLRMLGMAYTKDNDVIYLQDSIFHPEHYEYSVKLSRDMSLNELAWKQSSWV